eukprot:TRINITY_DN14154_c0_g1_i1.p1 TRINITY_DN14154_c0_g1~~TRINITY_DN14154_c0_g1_i1.p1  ORF type:complete len:146 (+),score=56.26 TRINITY_DN14154_c0_g1_i1:194-631(+)
MSQNMSESGGKMDTLFILDIMRLANQEQMREKKDARIKEMAMQQKKKKEQTKKDDSRTYSYNSGGFVGINMLRKGDGPKWVPNKKKQEVTSTEDAHVMTSDNELFILGLLKEQRQEEKDKERMEQVSESSLACASDKKNREKFER